MYGGVEYVDESRVNQKFLKKIGFTNSKGENKKYRRKDVAAFRANNNNYEGFWLNQTSRKIQLVNPRYDIDLKNGERFFLRVLSRGKISHYELEWFEQGESGLNFMDLLKKEKDNFFIRATQGLFGLKRKILIDYFHDCPKLRNKIKLKKFKEVTRIVNYYNSNCYKIK